MKKVYLQISLQIYMYAYMEKVEFKFIYGQLN